MTLANKITIARLCSIPILLGVIAMYSQEDDYLRWVAVAIFIAAAISDGIDGYLARNYDQRTKLGAVLDPTADKLLMNLSFIFLAANRELYYALPYWFPVAMVGRDLVIVFGSMALHEFAHPMRPVRPRWTGKWNTGFQIAIIIAVLIEFPLTIPIMWATVAMGVISVIDYFLFGLREAQQKDPA